MTTDAKPSWFGTISNQSEAYILLTLTTMFWAGNAVASRLALGHVSPFAMVMLRWFLALSLIWPLVRKDFLVDLPVLKQHKLFIFLMGVLGYTSFNALFYMAAYSTSAINIGIIQGGIPVCVLGLGAIFFGRSVTPKQIIGVGVTLVGVLILASQGEWLKLVHLQINFGDGLMLVAITGYSFYALALTKRPKVKPLSFYFAMAISAAISAFPLLIFEIINGKFIWPDRQGIMIVLYITIFPSILSQIFFLRGVDLIGPARSGIFVNLVPVFAPILAILILNEEFMAYHVWALSFVLIGIIIAEWRHSQRS